MNCSILLSTDINNNNNMTIMYQSREIVNTETNIVNEKINVLKVTVNRGVPASVAESPCSII